MNPSFEQTLVEVWRQALVENANFVELGKERYPVRRTPKRGLRQVDFVFDGNDIRGLEQNPDTKSRWAQMARSGKKVRRPAIYSAQLGVIPLPDEKMGEPAIDNVMNTITL